MTEMIAVEVAYAGRDEQVIVTLQVPSGTTVQQALELSAIAARFPELDLAQAKLGIFGKVVNPDQVLRARDRVEIYRPLLADPKEVRRRRAEVGKK